MRRTILAVGVATSAIAAGPAAIAADAAPAAASGKPATAGPQFLTMEEITAPIFSASRIEGSLSVTLVIEATTPAAATELGKDMPRLRATSLATAIEFSRLYASGLTPVNVAKLSADLNAALKSAHPGIARVLIVKVAAVPA